MVLGRAHALGISFSGLGRCEDAMTVDMEGEGVGGRR